MTFGQHPIEDPNDIHKVNMQLFSELRAEMEWAQTIETEQVNISRCVGMELQTEDKVWMDTRNLSTSQPNKKLD
jgi:hypothetical protein